MGNNNVVRFAREEDLPRVNELRKIVNDLHVNGRPNYFKPGFQEVANQLFEIWNADDSDFIVADYCGVICGYACVRRAHKSETPFSKTMSLYLIDEFCVDEAYRRQGVATEMIRFIRSDAEKYGMSRVELNMWEFNEAALAFYEAVGFKTFRRYMELNF